MSKRSADVALEKMSSGSADDMDRPKKPRRQTTTPAERTRNAPEFEEEFISLDILMDLLQRNDSRIERSLREGDTRPLIFAPKLADELRTYLEKNERLPKVLTFDELEKKSSEDADYDDVMVASLTRYILVADDRKQQSGDDDGDKYSGFVPPYSVAFWREKDESDPDPDDIFTLRPKQGLTKLEWEEKTKALASALEKRVKKVDVRKTA